MASSKAAASDKKKKESSSAAAGAKKTKSKDKAGDKAASKDTKDKSSKKPTGSSSTKSKSALAPATESAAPPAPPIPHDPDAVQLFRRYDRARAGALTRLDFLQLLRDYANPPTPSPEHASPHLSPSHGPLAPNAHRASARPHIRKPLSLTDTSGIPLGYERSDKNSEFEAGQLFERYDRDRTGALTLDKFHNFFVDFRPQLTAFVEDLNYFGVSPAQHLSDASGAAAPVPTPVSSSRPSNSSSSTGTKRHESDPSASQTSRLAEYQTALWKLRKLCKHELLDQRERILDTSRWSDRNESENQAVELYEAMEADLERIDDISAFVRRYVNKGSDISSDDIASFLPRARELQAQAQCLAMKDYAVPKPLETSLRPRKLASQPLSPAPSSSSSSSSRASQSDAKQRQGDKRARADTKPSSAGDALSGTTRAELTQLVRVKDEMIYELLRERTELRKQAAAMASYVQELSDVSTAEMKKWAHLTDEMQSEIARLRRQLRLSRS